MIPPRITAEIREWPGAVISGVRNGGKHKRLTIRYCGAERFVTLPSTPSDRRAELNQVRDVRKVLAELGAQRRPRAKQAVRREHNRHDREFLANIQRAPIKPNPFDALLAIQFAPEPAKGRVRRAIDWLFEMVLG